MSIFTKLFKKKEAEVEALGDIDLDVEAPKLEDVDVQTTFNQDKIEELVEGGIENGN